MDGYSKRKIPNDLIKIIKDYLFQLYYTDKKDKCIRKLNDMFKDVPWDNPLTDSFSPHSYLHMSGKYVEISNFEKYGNLKTVSSVAQLAFDKLGIGDSQLNYVVTTNSIIFERGSCVYIVSVLQYKIKGGTVWYLIIECKQDRMLWYTALEHLIYSTILCYFKGSPQYLCR